MSVFCAVFSYTTRTVRVVSLKAFLYSVVLMMPTS